MIDKLYQTHKMNMINFVYKWLFLFIVIVMYDWWLARVPLLVQNIPTVHLDTMLYIY